MRLLAGGTDSHEVIGPRLSEQRSAVALRTTSGWRLGGSAVKEVDHVRVWQGRNSRTGPPLSHRNTDAPNFALFEGGDQLPGTTLVSHPQDGHNYDDGCLNLRRHYGSGKPTSRLEKVVPPSVFAPHPSNPAKGGASIFVLHCTAMMKGWASPQILLQSKLGSGTAGAIRPSHQLAPFVRLIRINE